MAEATVAAANQPRLTSVVRTTLIRCSNNPSPLNSLQAQRVMDRSFDRVSPTHCSPSMLSSASSVNREIDQVEAVILELIAKVSGRSG